MRKPPTVCMPPLSPSCCDHVQVFLTDAAHASGAEFVPAFLCQLYFLTGQSKEARHEIALTNPSTYMHESSVSLGRKATNALGSKVFLNIGAVFLVL